MARAHLDCDVWAHTRARARAEETHDGAVRRGDDLGAELQLADGMPVRLHDLDALASPDLAKFPSPFFSIFFSVFVYFCVFFSVLVFFSVFNCEPERSL